MRTFAAFREDLYRAVAAQVDADLLDNVDLLDSVGAFNAAVVELIEIAALEPVPLPQSLIDEIRERAVSEVGFRPKVADIIRTAYLDKLQAAS